MENDKLVRMSDVIETVENQCSDGNMWGNDNLTLIDASKTIDELSDIPAVDAVLVKHGHWISSGVNGFDRCSNCKAIWDISLTRNMFFKHCPRCGALMDEVTNNGQTN